MCFQWEIRLNFVELGMFASFTRKMHGNLKTRKRGRFKIHERLTKCMSGSKYLSLALQMGGMGAGIRR